MHLPHPLPAPLGFSSGLFLSPSPPYLQFLILCPPVPLPSAPARSCSKGVCTLLLPVGFSRALLHAGHLLSPSLLSPLRCPGFSTDA